MLPPVSHNSLESAAKLYGPDYFTNSFRRNLFSIADPFGAAGKARWAETRASSCARSCSTATSTSASACSRDTGSARFRRPPRIRPWSAASTCSAWRGGCRSTCSTPSPGSSIRARISARRRSCRSASSTISRTTYKYFGGDFLVDLPVGPGDLHRAGQRRAVGRRDLHHAHQAEGVHGRDGLPHRTDHAQPHRALRTPRLLHADAGPARCRARIATAAGWRSGLTDTTRTSRSSSSASTATRPRTTTTRSTCSGKCTSTRLAGLTTSLAR